jgi:hypothetical protein
MLLTFQKGIMLFKFLNLAIGTRAPVSGFGAGLLPTIHLHLVIRSGTESLVTAAPVELRAVHVRQ